MTYAVIDVESTIFQKGNPFSDCNRLCLIGVRINGINSIIEVEYDQTQPYAEGLNLTRNLIDSVDTVVLFNAKFDLNWLARYGIILPQHIRVFDCQLVEFVLGQ
jgi:ribonuclease D